MRALRSAFLLGALVTAHAAPRLRASTGVKYTAEEISALLDESFKKAVAKDEEFEKLIHAPEGSVPTGRRLASSVTYSKTPIYPTGFSNGSATSWFPNNAFQVSNSLFGAALDTSNDGSTFVIGAPSFNFVQLGKHAGNSFGLASVSTSIKAPSVLEALNFPSIPADPLFQNAKSVESFQRADMGANFGLTLAMSDDGDKVVVGAPFSKVAFLYTNCSTFKCQLAYDFSSNTFASFASNNFGAGIGISPNGKWVVVADTRAVNPAFPPSDNSHAYGLVFVYNMSCSYAAGTGVADCSATPAPAVVVSPLQAGATLSVPLVPNPNPASTFQFGHSCWINSDGTRLVVGAPNARGFAGAALTTEVHGGYVYIFHFTPHANDDPDDNDGDNDNIPGWFYTDTLTPPTSDWEDLFGWDIDVRELPPLTHGDKFARYTSLLIAVGAPGGTPGFGAGVFKCIGINACVPKTWVDAGTPADWPANVRSQNLGQGVAISSDGSTFAIGGKYRYTAPAFPVPATLPATPNEGFFGTWVAIYTLNSMITGDWEYEPVAQAAGSTGGFQRGYGWGSIWNGVSNNDQVGGSFFETPVTMSGDGKVILLGNPVDSWKFYLGLDAVPAPALIANTLLSEHYTGAGGGGDCMGPADGAPVQSPDCYYALGIEAVTAFVRN